MGYGSRAITALNEFYSGELLNLNEVAAEMEVETFEDVAKTDKVRSSLELGSREAVRLTRPPLDQTERFPCNRSNQYSRRFKDASSPSTTFGTYSREPRLSRSIIRNHSTPVQVLEKIWIRTSLHASNYERFDG